MRCSSLFVLFSFCLHYVYALCIILKVGQYAKNPGAVCSLKYHLVWCPKYRRPVLVGAVDRRLKALLQQKTKELNIHIHTLEILPDHVHLFVEADPTRCVAEIVNRLDPAAGAKAGKKLGPAQLQHPRPAHSRSEIVSPCNDIIMINA